MKENELLINEILSHSDCIYQEEELKKMDESKLIDVSNSMLLSLRTKSGFKKNDATTQKSAFA